MANNENFIDNIKVAYHEHKKYSFWEDMEIDDLTLDSLLVSFGLIVLPIAAISLSLKNYLLASFFTFIFFFPFFAIFPIFNFMNKNRLKLKDISYLGAISDIFDISHPVIVENKGEILKHLEENKSLSGPFAFQLYCLIQKYDNEKTKKLTVNDIVYDEKYVENMIIQNRKDFEKAI